MAIIAKGTQGGTGEYEDVSPVNEWITSKIERVEYNAVFKNKFTEDIYPAVRFWFALENHQKLHISNWLRLSTHKKSTLYNIYIKGIFGSKYDPDVDLDVELLEKLDVATMWEEGSSGWFNMVKIKPLDKEQITKLDIAIPGAATQEQIPF
jgi:hypothetical protein